MKMGCYKTKRWVRIHEVGGDGPTKGLQHAVLWRLELPTHGYLFVAPISFSHARVSLYWRLCLVDNLYARKYYYISFHFPFVADRFKWDFFSGILLPAKLALRRGAPFLGEGS